MTYWRNFPVQGLWQMLEMPPLMSQGIDLQEGAEQSHLDDEILVKPLLP